MANPETGYFTAKSTAIQHIGTEEEGIQSIYTLQGKRVREAWKHLPAGVYVVNGKKIIKWWYSLMTWKFFPLAPSVSETMNEQETDLNTRATLWIYSVALFVTWWNRRTGSQCSRVSKENWIEAALHGTHKYKKHKKRICIWSNAKKVVTLPSKHERGQIWLLATSRKNAKTTSHSPHRILRFGTHFTFYSCSLAHTDLFRSAFAIAMGRRFLFVPTANQSF